MHSVTSNAVAEEINEKTETIIIEGGTDSGGNFIDENGNPIMLSQYSLGQYISKSGDSGFILTPYKGLNDPASQATWALYNPNTNAWVLNRTGLFALFRK